MKKPIHQFLKRLTYLSLSSKELSGTPFPQAFGSSRGCGILSKALKGPSGSLNTSSGSAPSGLPLWYSCLSLLQMSATQIMPSPHLFTTHPVLYYILPILLHFNVLHNQATWNLPWNIFFPSPKNLLSCKGISIAARTLPPLLFFQSRCNCWGNLPYKWVSVCWRCLKSIMESQELPETKNSVKQYRQHMKNIDCAVDIKIFKNYGFFRLELSIIWFCWMS